jgi:hypothetical protein
MARSMRDLIQDTNVDSIAPIDHRRRTMLSKKPMPTAIATAETGFLLTTSSAP